MTSSLPSALVMDPVKRSPFFSTIWSAIAGIARSRKRKLAVVCLRTLVLLVSQQVANYPRPGQRAVDKAPQRNWGTIPAGRPMEDSLASPDNPALDATWTLGVIPLDRVWNRWSPETT